MRANERTDERVAQYLRPDSWLFYPTVHSGLPGVVGRKKKPAPRQPITCPTCHLTFCSVCKSQWHPDGECHNPFVLTTSASATSHVSAGGDAVGGKAQRTVSRMIKEQTHRVLGHSLVRSLVRSHRSLIRLLRTARFARALRCAHSFARALRCAHSLARSAALIRSLARSLTHSRAHGKEVFFYGMNASISYTFNPSCVLRRVEKVRGESPLPAPRKAPTVSLPEVRMADFVVRFIVVEQRQEDGVIEGYLVHRRSGAERYAGESLLSPR